MAIKVNGTTVIDDSRVLSNAVEVAAPIGATGSRPGSPETYTLYINTSTSKLEMYNGSSWVNLASYS